jgi:hypothetical protein
MESLIETPIKLGVSHIYDPSESDRKNDISASEVKATFDNVVN